MPDLSSFYLDATPDCCITGILPLSVVGCLFFRDQIVGGYKRAEMEILRA